VSTFRCQLRPRVQGVYQDGGLVDVLATAGDLPDLDLEYLQGAGETWQHVLIAVSLAASANLDIDLANASNTVKDRAGRPLNLAKLYAVVLAIDSPDGTKALRLGPQNVSNGCQLWFGGTGSTNYELVDRTVVRAGSGGWTVTAGTGDILRLNNPTAGTVAGSLYLVGKQ
jgi:hypothetical protein